MHRPNVVVLFLTAVLLQTAYGYVIITEPVQHISTWEDFDGTIPKNALIGGTDERGTIYIGQVMYRDMIIPGKLYEDDKHIYFEFGEQSRKRAKNIKILCTDYPEKFIWISTKTTQFDKVKDQNLVIGGYQSNFLTYIGKTIVKDETDLGKVICKKDSCLALYTWYHGRYVEYHSYYILAYANSKENEA